MFCLKTESLKSRASVAYVATLPHHLQVSIHHPVTDAQLAFALLVFAVQSVKKAMLRRSSPQRILHQHPLPKRVSSLGQAPRWHAHARNHCSAGAASASSLTGRRTASIKCAHPQIAPHPPVKRTHACGAAVWRSSSRWGGSVSTHSLFLWHRLVSRGPQLIWRPLCAMAVGVGAGGALRRVRRASLSRSEESQLCERPKQSLDSVRSVVDPILADVRDGGDASALEWSSHLDSTRPEPLIQPISGPFPPPGSFRWSFPLASVPSPQLLNHAFCFSLPKTRPMSELASSLHNVQTCRSLTCLRT